jgi:hypothetical protein
MISVIVCEAANPRLEHSYRASPKYYRIGIARVSGIRRKLNKKSVRVITNINERNYPSHPHGKFAFIAPGSKVAIPEDAVHIELNSHKAKILGRVELKDDKDGAEARKGVNQGKGSIMIY